jgi:hypothetical protein
MKCFEDFVKRVIEEFSLPSSPPHSLRRQSLAPLQRFHHAARWLPCRHTAAGIMATEGDLLLGRMTHCRTSAIKLLTLRHCHQIVDSASAAKRQHYATFTPSRLPSFLIAPDCEGCLMRVTPSADSHASFAHLPATWRIPV